jgi:hypothetical protein
MGLPNQEMFDTSTGAIRSLLFSGRELHLNHLRLCGVSVPQLCARRAENQTSHSLRGQVRRYEAYSCGCLSWAIEPVRPGYRRRPTGLKGWTALINQNY